MPLQLSVGRIGRFFSVVESGTENMDAGEIAASTYDASSSNLWIYELGGVVAAQVFGSGSTFRLALYETATNGDPRTRACYTAQTTLTNNAFTRVELGISSTTGPAAGFAKAYASRKYAVAALGVTNGWAASYRTNPGTVDETARRKVGVAQPPPDPFSFTATTADRAYTFYAEGWINVAPEQPTTGFAPADASTVNATAPTFAAGFLDLNGAYGASSGNGIDAGDRITAYQVQLRAQGTTPLLWNATYTATSAEQTANAISRAYGGSALSLGGDYEWAVRMADEFGVYGPWSDWIQFSIATAGFVTLDGNPTGKTLDTTPDFQGRWTHASATSMKTVQVRLLNAAGTVIQTGADYNIADVASSASPGTLFTVPWANTGLSTLEWGTSYQYQIRGFDGTDWSDWSAARAFSTDAAPAIPSQLSPNDGTVRTSYPLLRAMTSDADDTVGSLTVKVVITRPNATTVTVTLPYNATTGFYEYQTTSTEVSADGTYTWEPYAGDGTLWSGVATVEASASKALGTFTYATGPVVTITTPTDASTVASASLNVTWTTTDQQAYKVLVTDDADGSTVYQNNAGDWTISTTPAHLIPVGYLRNGHDYTLTVTVRNSFLVTGASSASFAVSLTPADPVANLQVTPVKVGTDPWETAIKISFDASTVDANEFREHTLYRRAAGGPDAAEIVLARLGQTASEYTDHFPASGVEYTYGVRVVTSPNGLDELESEVSEGSATVVLGGLVLCRVASAATDRAILTYRLSGDPLGRQRTRRRPEAVFTPLSGGAPRTTQGASRWWETTAEAVFVDDAWADATTRADELEAMDEAGGTLCARDERGRKEFVVMADGGLVLTDRRPLYYDVSVTLRQEFYVEGA